MGGWEAVMPFYHSSPAVRRGGTATGPPHWQEGLEASPILVSRAAKKASCEWERDVARSSLVVQAPGKSRPMERERLGKQGPMQDLSCKRKRRERNSAFFRHRGRSGVQLVLPDGVRFKRWSCSFEMVDLTPCEKPDTHTTIRVWVDGR